MEQCTNKNEHKKRPVSDITTFRPMEEVNKTANLFIGFVIFYEDFVKRHAEKAHNFNQMFL